MASVLILVAGSGGIGSPAALSSPSPTGTLGTNTSATVSCTTNQSTGTLYAVIDIAANLVGITVAQIKAGNNKNGSAAVSAGNIAVSNSGPSLTLSGLTANTAYSYAMAQNNANGDSNISVGTFTTATAASALFTDNFASGNFSHTQNGFTWGGGNTGFVSVVSVAALSPPLGATNAVKFDFGTSNNAQLNFSLGGGYGHMFFRWYEFYPNGTEGFGPAWSRTGTLNNKKFRLADLDPADSVSVGVRFGYSTEGNGTGADLLFEEYGQPGSYASPGPPPTAPGSPVSYVQTSTLGQWNKFELEIQSPTVTPSGWGVGNGVMKCWFNNALIITDTATSQCGANGLQVAGYLMGFPNSPLANAGSAMYITNFAFGTSGRV